MEGGRGKGPKENEVPSNNLNNKIAYVLGNNDILHKLAREWEGINYEYIFK